MEENCYPPYLSAAYEMTWNATKSDSAGIEVVAEKKPRFGGT